MANNKTDYTKPHTDLIELLPEPLRSDVNISLFNNVFNRYLTKQEIEKVAGYIGRGNTAAIRPRQIHEQDVHRQAYQLQPIPYNKIGTIEHMTSWKDMQNELERLGVDMDAFSEWGATQKFNWVPPIDINKIINYRDYYWVDTADANSIPQYITIRSTCATATAKFNFWDALIEQHGATFQIDEILPTDTTPTTYTITEFITSPSTVKVEGDVTLDILLGEYIDIIGSTNNDETYRITSTPEYSGVTNETTLRVDAAIVADVPSITAEVSTRRFDKLVLPANTTLVGSPPVEIEDLGNYTSLFTEGFIFFIRNSTNTDLNSAFIETISSSYDSDKKETTVIINHRVTDDTANGEISLEEQYSIYEADMKCQCDEFGGWDVSQWDDNPLEPLWGDTENADGDPEPLGGSDGISDHENLITRISHTTPPISGDGIEGELWYDTIENILYQNSALPITETKVDTFVVAPGSPVVLTFDLSAPISTGTIVTAEKTNGSPTSLNVSYTADGSKDPVVTVLDPLNVNDIIVITYETPIWMVVWRNFSLILEQTVGISLWDLSLSCDTRPRITATEQWIKENKWLHKNDVVNFTSTQRANQPIIEYDWDVELNEWTYINYNWSYRRIITETFETTVVEPPRIELEKLIWWEHDDDVDVVNGITLDDRYGDLTNYFVEGRTVFFVEGSQKALYTVVASSYKSAEAIQGSGEYVFPYRTYITFDKTVISEGSPAITNNLSHQRPNVISIIPETTSQGDTWKDYGVHWLFVGADDAVPAPHPVPNPFIDIDVVAISTPYPPVTPPATGSPATGSPPAGSPPAPAVSSWDIRTASWPVFYDTATPHVEPYVPDAIAFGDSGNKMYLTSTINRRIYEYNLGTPYDSTTISFVHEIDLTWTIPGSITSMYITTDGGRIILSDVNNNIQSFLLQVNWDITSIAESSPEIYIIDYTTDLGGGQAIGGMQFSTDGLKMFTIFSESGVVHQYNLTSAFAPVAPNISLPANLTFDLSTITNFGTSLGLTQIDGISLSPDGTLMQVIDSEDDIIYQYILNPAWDITTAIEDTTLDIAITDGAGELTFNSDGSELYILGRNDVFQNTLSSPGDITGLSVPGQLETLQSDSTPEGLVFSADGAYLYIAGNSSNIIRQYTLDGPYDITTLATPASSPTLIDATVMDVEFNAGGDKMYILGEANDTVYQYDLSPAWDVTSAIIDNSNTLYVGGIETIPRGMHIGDSGSKLYMVGSFSATIYEYTLDTPYDVGSNTTPPVQFDIASQNQFIDDVYISPDGSAMYTVSYQTLTIYQYVLNTPWDLSSAVYDNKSFYAGGEEGAPTGMTMTSDGLQMFLIGTTTRKVREYFIDPI